MSRPRAKPSGMRPVIGWLPNPSSGRASGSFGLGGSGGDKLKPQDGAGLSTPQEGWCRIRPSAQPPGPREGAPHGSIGLRPWGRPAASTNVPVLVRWRPLEASSPQS